MSVCNCLMQVITWKEFVVSIVSSVQDDMWANLLALCFLWSFGNGKISGRIDGGIWGRSAKRRG
jgi:hypothetical protein